jgi:hypothetical protein
MPQARAVYLMGRELGMTADVALHLQADDEELMRRLLARAALEHRSDDTTDIIAQRLALYHAVTSPILSWYRDRGILVSVDAMRSALQVGREILTALEAMRPFLDHVPGQARLSVDLTGLGDAFGAAGSTAGTSDLADGLHRRLPRLVGAGWLDPGERRRAGCRVPDGLLRAVRGVVASGAGGCGRWLAQAGLMCRAVRRRLAARSAASAVRESVTASVTLAWSAGGWLRCLLGIVQSAALAAALGAGDEVGQRAGAAGEHPGQGGGVGMGRSAGFRRRSA